MNSTDVQHMEGTAHSVDELIMLSQQKYKQEGDRSYRKKSRAVHEAYQDTEETVVPSFSL